MYDILSEAGIYQTLKQSKPLLEPTFLPPSVVIPFSWEGGEDANSLAACERLSNYLSAAGVSMGEDSGYKVVDVHWRDVLSIQLGRIKLRGRTDAIITPANQAEIHAHHQSRIVIDFKTKCPSLAEIEGQSLAELAAANGLSHHDVMVVFTDLNATAHIWRLDGDSLLLWEGCSVREGISVMATFLRDMCAPIAVKDLEASAVPGLPDSKRRRMEPVTRLHELVPKNELLMDQICTLAGGDDTEGWLAAREVAYSALEASHGQQPMTPPAWLSYIS